jgi:eukaryotic-like serine/threonine-protein kinase
VTVIASRAVPAGVERPERPERSASLDAPDAIGRYEVVLELGRGGMAVLYLARARGVGGFTRMFAIKRILPHLAADPAFVEMFLDEGRIAARLSHPNLCPVFELGQDRGELFLVMDYLDGVAWEVLAAAAPRDRRGLALAAGVLAQACDGLHHAHTFRDVDGTALPVVHRDVSPQNLFVSSDGTCRVLDFGVSKIASDPRRTRTGVRKGKLPYMAPEQIRGEPLDARADVWAVGVMLWEALTGEPLFDRDTDFLTYQAITEAAIPPVTARARAASYPAAIDRVIARALARDRDQRHASARELGHDLLELAGEVGGAASREAIADAVARLCGDPIAARRQAIADALARRAAAEAARAASTVPGAAAAEGPAGADRDAAATVSMAMRKDAIVVRRRGPSRGRRRAGLVGLAAIAAGIAVASLVRGPARPAPPAPASRSAPSAPAAPSASAATAPAPSAVQPAGSGPMAPASPSAAPPPSAATPAASAPAAPRGSAAPGGSAGGPASSAAAPASPGSRQVAVRAGSGRPAAAPAAARPHDPAVRPSGDDPPAAAAPGWYAIDSSPYATIFIDDRKIGDTPLDRIALPAGSHRVRAVLADGRQRMLTITIAPDLKTSQGTLRW